MPGSRTSTRTLIDLSEAALKRSVQTLATIDDPQVRVTTHQATYEDGLLVLPAERAHPTLVAFLGSNLGNFDPPGAAAFLGLIRAALQPNDYLLLGVDLVKPERDLLLAYDDPLGLTAAFNKNLLLRLNTELDADFELDRFAHRAVWNREASRVEMHLVSLDGPGRSRGALRSPLPARTRGRPSGPRARTSTTRNASESSSTRRDSLSGISGSTTPPALR